MELIETLKKMKESMGENYFSSVEAMKRRAEKGLLEGITASDIDRAVDDIENSGVENVNEQAELISMIAETEEVIKKYGSFEEKPLTEAVTFIDNAGNLKTMTTPDYVKDMHEYHTEIQIEKYKKKKKIDYKLLSEAEFKKLSEMTIDEILAENDTEILNALRSDLQGELKAIKDYEDHADEAEKAGFKDVADVMRDISREEKVHCGELQVVLDKHDKENKKAFKDGEAEAKEKMAGGGDE